MNESKKPKRSKSAIRRTDLMYFLDLAPTKVGGAELFALHLGRSLEKLGISITYVFVGEVGDCLPDFFDRPNMQVLRLDNQAGFSLQAIWALTNLIRRVRPSIAMYYLGGIVRPLPWIARIFGAKQIVYSDHASRFTDEGQPGKFKLFVMRFITRPVTAVIAVSEFVAECNRAERMHCAPVTFIPNAADVSRNTLSATRQEFLAKYGIPENRLIVSQLSSLIPEKGVDTFLRAAALILQKRDDVHFIVGGEGPGLPEYERLTSDLGISQRVTFIGKIQDPLASGYYPACDIFCLASRWKEAWGLVLLEAMSFGVPVVATRIGGIPEFVRHGIDGLLTEGNPEAFATAIIQLLQNPDLRRKIHADTPKWVESQFEMSGIVPRYVEVLLGHSLSSERENATGVRGTS